MRPLRLLHALVACAALVAANGCRRPTDPDPLVGTWLATSFHVAVGTQAQKDILAAGGSFGVNVATNFVTAGTVVLPASVTGGAASTLSLAGTAVEAGTTVQFGTSADTFVRNLVFTLIENRLEARNQVVAGTTYDVVLTRQ